MKKQTTKKSSVNIASIVITVISMIPFCICGALIAIEGRAVGANPILNFAVELALMLAMLLLQIIVHEAGHLVFGLMSGYKFVSFNILGVVLLKQDGKFKLRRLNVVGMGGQCLMSPPEMKDGRLPVFLFNYGGVFLNLIASAAVLVIYLFLMQTRFLSFALLAFSIIGAGLALSNGIPLKDKMVSNDGYNALCLGRDKDALFAFWMQLKTAALTYDGVRLKDMPAKWFEVPSDEKMKNTMIAPIGVFACGRLVDEHKFKEADELMARLLSKESGIVGIHKSLMICDRVYIELITENRTASIDAFLTKEQKKFMQAMKKFPSVIRTEYAYAALHEKDGKKTDKLKKQFEKCAKTYPAAADIESERELIQIVDSKRF